MGRRYRSMKTDTAAPRCIHKYKWRDLVTFYLAKKKTTTGGAYAMCKGIQMPTEYIIKLYYENKKKKL